MLDLPTAGGLASMQWWMLVHEFIFTEWTLTSNVQRTNQGREIEGQAAGRRQFICHGSFPPGVFLFQRTWAQVGVYRKPSLSALPAPPINSGEMMTLKCCSDAMFETFILVVYREDVNEVQMRLAGEPYAGGSQVNISIAPVTAAHAGTYLCYSSSSQHSHVWSHPSDPLDIVISVPDATNSSYHLNVTQEALPLPILWAEPGSIISWGKSVTILCQGNIQAQEYYLNKEGRTSRLYSQTVMEPGSKAMFPILFITELYAGRYRCYYESPAGSSEHSDMLELVVTDVYSKPSLSALPSSVVTPGENVTFQCVSWLGFETFILTEEGENKLSWMGDSQRHPNGHMQALFPMGPVSPGHRRKFRCYGYDNSNAQVWSAPSEPLELIISGMVETTSSSPNMSDPKTGSHLQDHTVENLTRITLGGLVLLVLGILLFDAQHSQRKTPDAARR
ncbi:leukocyte immunoglobulin-like receptor subfamily A member 5 isoform X3 [Peromyscus maniculatus bairdii]|uniref:leukocyte immunoglobulin-like receptor subfamily A member 5 isoform X3 n=1 Tax=Peromyscus maniculatus bairdii TaxID=230844 RepID=UPI003FCFF15E